MDDDQPSCVIGFLRPGDFWTSVIPARQRLLHRLAQPELITGPVIAGVIAAEIAVVLLCQPCPHLVIQGQGLLAPIIVLRFKIPSICPACNARAAGFL